MSPNHTHMAGAVWPASRTEPVDPAPADVALLASMAKQKAATESGPCLGCRHADRCAQGLACRALELFVNVGRFSAFAPRQLSAAIYQRIHDNDAPRRPSEAERRRAREALAVKTQREALDF